MIHRKLQHAKKSFSKRCTCGAIVELDPIEFRTIHAIEGCEECLPPMTQDIEQDPDLILI